ncbi:hypothetical protein ORJ04_18415 [Rheinheimera baltica]|uniref:Orphan protein n=1 Tax=Rheinheimera baltica TaxID=67576 RepID=A0ABT9I3I3_9GAMM|nr:hypothetical protein [Rheinheimera baltica]MDP5137929.1 hypothetical protein [Rheinheimera baltica]
MNVITIKVEQVTVQCLKAGKFTNTIRHSYIQLMRVALIENSIVKEDPHSICFDGLKKLIEGYELNHRTPLPRIALLPSEAANDE